MAPVLTRLVRVLAIDTPCVLPVIVPELVSVVRSILKRMPLAAALVAAAWIVPLLITDVPPPPKNTIPFVTPLPPVAVIVPELLI